MRPRTIVVLVLIGLTAMLAGCATSGAKYEAAVKVMFDEWSIKNRQQHLAHGEKVFDKPKDEVFSSIVTAFADLGYTVKNMERESGYILGEGDMAVPMTERQKLAQDMCDELNRIDKRPPPWKPKVGNTTYAISATVMALSPQKTKVKLRIGSTEVRGAAAVNSGTFPPLLDAHYAAIWRGIDRQIFLDQSLDKK
jgi:hypothetical protein